MKVFPIFEVLWQDVRYGARLLRKNPGFTAINIVTLALGIGATTAIYSMLDAMLFKPLPYRDSDRLTMVWLTDPTNPRFAKVFATYADFLEWKRNSSTMEETAGFGWANAGQNLVLPEGSQRVLAVPVTPQFFTVLGAQAAQGRTFTEDDRKSGCSVVLSNRVWKNMLGGTQGLVGHDLKLNGQSCTVLGIMPASFQFFPLETDLWTVITDECFIAKNPRESTIVALARLGKNISRDTAQAELATLHKSVADQAPPGHWLRQFTPVVFDLREELTSFSSRSLRAALYVLSAAVILVLLICCVNVANLLMGKGGARQREFTVRLALGSSRTRLVRQLLTESVLLSLMGSSVGVLLAWAGVRYLRSLSWLSLPPGNPVTVSLRVLFFTALLAIFTAILFGLIPAWKMSRVEMTTGLRETGRNGIQGNPSRRASKLLVMTEVALSVILLVGATMMIETIARLNRENPAYRSDQVLTAFLNLSPDAYPKLTQQASFYERVLNSFTARPGVEGVALTAIMPPYPGAPTYLNVADRPAFASTAVRDVTVNAVSPGYFRVMGVPLLRGRFFSEADRDGAPPVAIVNIVLVRKYFPDQNPIGQQIKTGEYDSTDPWMTIVGIVPGEPRIMTTQDMGFDVTPFVYRPVAQAGGNRMGIVLRGAGKAAAITPQLRSEVAAIDKGVSLSYVLSLKDRLQQWHAQPSLRASLLGLFSAIALLLAGIGIYGVLSQSVSQRSQEIGVRMAIGAQQRDVFRLVLMEGISFVGAGLCLGIAGGLALTYLIRNLLYETSPMEPTAYLAVSGIVIGVALAACYIPGRRAANVDPMEALRCE